MTLSAYFRATILVAAALTSNIAIAQYALFAEQPALAQSSNAEQAQRESDSGSFERSLSDASLQADEYLMDLMGESVLIKRMQIKQESADNGSPQAAESEPEQSLDVFYFAEKRGSIVFNKTAGKIVSARIHDVEAQRTFIGEMSASGSLAFAEQDINSFICSNYDRVENAPDRAEANPDRVANSANVTLAQVRSLESRPGAARVIFIDYWGGTVTGTAWNADNNGNDINYEPYNSEGSSATFTQRELEIMYAAWAEAAEDYAPFDVNITTDESVFNAVAPNRRSRMIASPTTTVAPGSGGVAYVGIFGETPRLGRAANYYSVGWTFNTGFGSMGMTHSHEAGHQMGLSHDGVPGRVYYGGHNNWGPIMGGPFGSDYVQWSKGDYENANQSQNDLEIIKGRLPVVADEAGNNNANAEPIAINNTQLTGIITPAGLTPDVDVYLLQQAASSTVNIDVESFAKGLRNGLGVNLSMRVELRNSGGDIIAQQGPANPNSSAANAFSFEQNLDAGTYYLSIRNQSPNSNPFTGFDEYGNGGFYRLSVSGGLVSTKPDLFINQASITPQSIDASSSSQVTLRARVRNSGTNAQSYNVRFYRSNDSTISTSDTVLRTVSESTDLASNQISAEYLHSFNPPTNTGRFYYGVCVTSVIPSEDNQANNCSSALTLNVTEDQDSDGVVNSLDNCPSDPNPNQANFDGDNFGDVCDSDIDNDGRINALDSNDRNKRICADTDRDSCDDCSSGTFNTGNDGLDTDRDGLCNVGDNDDDGDGDIDSQDNCPLVRNANQANYDGDTFGDACDADIDNDGRLNALDSDDRNKFVCSDADRDSCNDCSSGVFNTDDDGLDTDSDGICNLGDNDDDGDGDSDSNDNCPLVRNADQANFDNDQFGDVCDADIDNDGRLNALDSDDRNRFVCSDTDRDSCNDCGSGLFNPANDGNDLDGDGLCDVGDADDDGDNVNDTTDNCPSSPNADQANFDGDSDGDACDNDIDNDGSPNGRDSNSMNPRVCSDDDGDRCDDCSLGRYNVNNDGPDANNNGICDISDPSDSDGDGYADNVDNCPAVPNEDQADRNGNGVGNVCEEELCIPLTTRDGGMAIICL